MDLLSAYPAKHRRGQGRCQRLGPGCEELRKHPGAAGWGVEQLLPRPVGKKALELCRPLKTTLGSCCCEQGLKLTAPWVCKSRAWAVPKQTRKGESLYGGSFQQGLQERVGFGMVGSSCGCGGGGQRESSAWEKAGETCWSSKAPGLEGAGVG